MRTLVFLVVGVVLGLLAARLRRPANIAVVPATSPPAAHGASPRDHGAGSGRVAHSVRPRDIPPTDRRYNPVALSQEDPDLRLKDIFDGEPRDREFAPVMEKRVRDALHIIFSELKLDSKIRKIEIECKTLSCYTQIVVADEDVELVYDEINGILLGDQQVPGIAHRSGVGHSNAVTIYNLYRPATRDVAYYEKFLAEAMRVPLEISKQKFLETRSGSE